jgi:hypothetical protein
MLVLWKNKVYSKLNTNLFDAFCELLNAERSHFNIGHMPDLSQCKLEKESSSSSVESEIIKKSAEPSEDLKETMSLGYKLPGPNPSLLAKYIINL